MATLRALILNFRKLALVLLALTMCVKALIPAGFMVERKAMVLTVSICADGLGTRASHQLVIPMESEPESHHGDQSKRNGSCGFTTLGFGALEAVDPLLLAVAFLFILTLGFIAYPPRRHTTPRRNLPPAQGPPLFG